MQIFNYDFETVLMNENHGLNNKPDNYHEVILFNPEDFTKQQAVEKAHEIINSIPYGHNLNKPTVNDVVERYIKENVSFDDYPEDEDAYFYTSVTDPDAMLILELNLSALLEE